MPLDIRRLARDGLLSAGRSFTWQWTTDGRPWASIQIRVEQWCAVLSFRFARSGQPAEDINQVVPIETTPCTFGGSRSWFLCPACCRRVAVVYGTGRLFACRACKKLAYSSQNENLEDRALRRANRIRKELGWPPGVIHGHGPKPPGMHWQTFRRLCHQHDVLTHTSLTGMARRMGLLRSQIRGVDEFHDPD